MPTVNFTLSGTKKIIGEIDYWFKNYQTRREMFLELIYVKPEYRRKGYGHSLLNIAINIAKFEKCSLIRISCPYKSMDLPYSSYEIRKKFFEGFGFDFDETGEYAVLWLVDQGKTLKVK